MGGAGQPKDFCDICGKHTGGRNCHSHTAAQMDKKAVKQKRVVKKDPPQEVKLAQLMRDIGNSHTLVSLEVIKLGVILQIVNEQYSITAIKEIVAKFKKLADNFNTIAREIEKNMGQS